MSNKLTNDKSINTESTIGTREAKSIVDFKVIKDYAICEFTYLVSTTGIVSEKIPFTQYKSMTIAGYGELTNGFEIGDVVVISQNIQNLAPYLIDIPSNTKGLANTRKMFDLLTKEEVYSLSRSAHKIKLVDYFAIPSFEILGYYPKDSEAAQHIRSLVGGKTFKREEAISRFEITPLGTAQDNK